MAKMTVFGFLCVLLVFVRVLSAFFNNITDCDETFNYWEPMHFIMYGSGFQTWEYSPEYALRSYAYLNIYALFGNAVGLLTPSRVSVFYAVRLAIALFTAFCELTFVSSIRHCLNERVANLTLFFLAFSSGMFISSSAFLPSSFATCSAMLAFASWYYRRYREAITFIAIGGIVAWPFAVALGVPLAFDFLFLKRRFVTFISSVPLIGLAVAGPLVAIDSYYYGRPVLAPLNILMYNVFSGSTSSELYGTEPFSFYFMNLFLNFNFAFLLAVLHPFILVVGEIFKGKKESISALYFAPLWLWCAIFFSQDHKEERFLFPAYPLIAFAAAHCWVLASSLFVSLSEKLSGFVKVASVVLLVVFVAFSASRTASLYTGYHAPMKVYNDVALLDTSTRLPNASHVLCVGKEWYRFSSSFFLPHGMELAFIKSEFRALLPKPYDAHNGTRGVPSHMNKLNLEEPTRYVELSKCDYLVDFSTPRTTVLEPNYRLSPIWQTISCYPFLDASSSHRVFRAFYVPGVTPTSCSYHPYCLLKQRRPSPSQ